MPDPSLLLPPPIEFPDFISSLARTKSTVALEDLKKYEQWTAEFGEEGASGFIQSGESPEESPEHPAPIKHLLKQHSQESDVPPPFNGDNFSKMPSESPLIPD